MIELEVTTSEGRAQGFHRFHTRKLLRVLQTLSNDEIIAQGLESDLSQALELAVADWNAGTLPDDLSDLLINSTNKVARRLGFRGNYKRRIEFGLKALEVARSRNNQNAVAEICASTVAWAYLQQGDYDEAWEFAKQGLAAATETGSAKWAAEACRILSGVGRDQLDAATAKHWAQAARAYAELVDDDLLEKQTRMDIGFGELLSRNFNEAEALNRQLLREYIDLNDSERIANFYGGLAVIVLHQGRIGEAKDLYNLALQTAKEINHDVMIAEAEFGLANVLEAEARLRRENARNLFARSEIKRRSRADQLVTIPEHVADAHPRT